MSTSTLHIPNDEREALEWLIPALDKLLLDMPHDAFMKAWHAVSYLYGGLHPDEATDHGTEIANDQDGPERFRLIEPRLINPYYKQSGWPLVLAPLAEEAWQRFEDGLMADDEFYCYDACNVGLLDRFAEAKA